MGSVAEERRLRLRRFVLEDLPGEPDLDLADDDARFSSGLVDSFSLVRLLAFLQTELGATTWPGLVPRLARVILGR